MKLNESGTQLGLKARLQGKGHLVLFWGLLAVGVSVICCALIWMDRIDA
jgi:hypothetical protein